MKEAVIASAVAAGLVLLLGLEGCTGRLPIWDQRQVFHPTASPSASAKMEKLTEGDRRELNRILAQLK